MSDRIVMVSFRRIPEGFTGVLSSVKPIEKGRGHGRVLATCGHVHARAKAVGADSARECAQRLYVLLESRGELPSP